LTLTGLFCGIVRGSRRTKRDRLAGSNLSSCSWRVRRIGWPAWNLAWFSVVGSNIFSNVPIVLVAGKWINNFAQPELMWKAMALATTFAGNLTIIGSVANIIVVESARKHVEIGFWDYARFGIPVTILTTVVGMVILVLLGVGWR
jgi:Na+/H+ antiporter NhaD/arsenite permease-like protein